jgi:hypothetical protein
MLSMRFLSSVLSRLISAVARSVKLLSFFSIIYFLYQVTRTASPFVAPVWLDWADNLFQIQLPRNQAANAIAGFGKDFWLLVLSLATYIGATWLTYRVDAWLSRRRLDGFLIRSRAEAPRQPKKDLDSSDEFVLAYARPAERTGRMVSYIFQIIGLCCGLLVWHYFTPRTELLAYIEHVALQLNPAYSSGALPPGGREMFIRLGLGLCGMGIALFSLYRIIKREARAHSLHYYMTNRALVVMMSYLGGWFKAGYRPVFWRIKSWQIRKIEYKHLRMPEPQTTFTEEFFWNRRTMTIPFESDVALEGPEAILHHVKPEFFWLTDNGKREEFIKDHPELLKN